MAKKFVYETRCVKFKRSTNDMSYTVTFNKMTRGAVLALKNALENYPQSIIAQEILDYFNSGVQETGDELLKNVMK